MTPTGSDNNSPASAAEKPAQAAEQSAPAAGQPTSGTDAVSRRTLLLTAGAGGFVAGAAGVGLGAYATLSTRLNSAPAAAGAETAPAAEPTTPHRFVGQLHQPGIATAAQPHALVVTWRLIAGATVEDVVRVLRLATQDVDDLMAGTAPVADAEPELVERTSGLTVTFGFGPGLFDLPELQDRKPRWFTPLPEFTGDQLRPEYTGGDLVTQLCGNDFLGVHHTSRVLERVLGGAFEVVGRQAGYLTASPQGGQQRNLFGQIDGTINPAMADPIQARSVWRAEPDDPAWLAGGTTMVVRRFAMDMAGWAKVSRPQREQSIGRTLDTGAPLTGGDVTDDPDFDARTADGDLVIAENAHVRLAHSTLSSDMMLRRGYNFTVEAEPNPEHRNGLLFISFQADVARQFVSVQEILAEKDPLNEWITGIGSAVFLVPRGVADGEYVGQELFEA